MDALQLVVNLGEEVCIHKERLVMDGMYITEADQWLILHSYHQICACVGQSSGELGT